MNINRATLRLYFEQTRKHRVSFVMMLVAIPVGAMVIDSLLPYVLSQAIGTLGHGVKQLSPLLFTAAGVGLGGALLNYIGFKSMVHHEGMMLANLRSVSFSRLIHKDHEFFSNQKIGAMTSRYIEFVRSYVTIQDLFVIRTLGFVLTVGSGLIILLRESPLISAIVLLLIIVLSVEIYISTKIRAPWRHERKELVSTIHGEVADALTNNLIVRSYAGEAREAEHVGRLSKRFTKIYKKDIGFVMTEGSLRVLLMVSTQVVAIVISAHLVGTGAMTLAAAIFVLAYMQRVGSQLFTLSDIINGYDRALLDAQQMTEMLLVPNQVNDTPGVPALQIMTPAIDIDSMSYRYPDGKGYALQDISLHIPAGQKVGLVGHSGAGKSTIAQLLLRFSDVSDGSIKISGQDIRTVSQTSLRECIGYVPQEPLLFHRSLRDNIAYGNPEASDKMILDAARQANVLEFIDQLSHGLDTLVGERGVKLSGGQRQRIAIARAILKNAPILLLDEATSALDSESEKLIQNSLDNLMEGRTSLVVAHRLSTIAHLDRIIVLDHGRVIEDGTHHELIAKDGAYASLWKHQSGGFIEE